VLASSANALTDPAKSLVIEHRRAAVDSLQSLLASFRKTLSSYASRTSPLPPLTAQPTVDSSSPSSSTPTAVSSSSALAMEIEKQSALALSRVHHAHMKRLAETSASTVLHMLHLAQSFYDLVNGNLSLVDDKEQPAVPVSGGSSSLADSIEDIDFLNMARREAADVRSFYVFFTDQMSSLSQRYLTAMDDVVSDARKALLALPSVSSAHKLNLKSNVTAPSSKAAAPAVQRQVDKIQSSSQMLKTEMYLDVSNANGKLQDALEYLVPIYQAVAMSPKFVERNKLNVLDSQ